MGLSAFLTDLGDMAVATPVAAAVAVWCWRRVDGQLALCFSAVLTATVAATTILKVFSRHLFPPPGWTGLLHLSSGAPSGHAVLSCLIYGFSAWLFIFASQGRGRMLGALTCLGGVAVVLVTRVTLHKHTIADVAAGVAVAAPAFMVLAKVVTVRAPRRAAPALELLILGVVVALGGLMSGVRMPSTLFL